MGYIYCITSPSGKKYVGQTTRDYTKRFREHCKLPGGCILLENAIKKYGKNAMTFEVLEETDNLNEREIFYIQHFHTMEPHGYNVRSGGTEATHSQESRTRMREAKLGEKNHNFGKPRTDEAKQAISLAKSGEHHHFFGKELSHDHKLKLSESHKKYNKSLPMYVVYIKERPQQYQGAGYAVVNHPTLPTKYFTSKKSTEEEKLNNALTYLQSA